MTCAPVQPRDSIELNGSSRMCQLTERATQRHRIIVNESALISWEVDICVTKLDHGLGQSPKGRRK
jgi:hypothetical protein